MKQIFISRPGPPEVLETRESADPEAGPGAVRVRVKAVGINFADLVGRTGMYRDAPPIPYVPGYEVSGVIDQLGAGVTDLSVGDRVCAMPRFGGYTDTAVLPALQVFRVPDAMSFEEAAGMPVVYLTAHHMMVFTGKLRRGAKVFIHSAAGGVGLAAIQLARAYDCEIFGTASPGKHEFLRGEGCQHPIDSGADVFAEARKILGEGKGVDLVLDPVGGPMWKAGYALLGEGGNLVCFGFSSGMGGKTKSAWRAVTNLVKMPFWNPVKLMMDNKGVSGVNMEHLFDRLDLLRPQFASLVEMYNRGAIKPHIDRSFSFAEAAQAHHYLHDRKAKGKVLLKP